MKIIQIVIGPDNSTYQGVMLGLGDDGDVYVAEGDGWGPYFECKRSPTRFVGEDSESQKGGTE